MTRLVIVGGSDAGISAALRARELDPGGRVDMLLADRWPNFSIGGLPYLLSGEVAQTGDLAHRTLAEIEAAGIFVHLEHRALRVDADRKVVLARDAGGAAVDFEYDAVVLATGAEPQRPPIAGLQLDGVHQLHTIDDALAVAARLVSPHMRRAVIVGGGYPYSATPTRHRVRVDDRVEVFAMCAIDALGIAFMVGEPTRVTSTDPAPANRSRSPSRSASRRRGHRARRWSSRAAKQAARA
jgi:Pyridine nucleotide-disulphide oxidoreductase/Alkylmercury lyase